MSGLYGAVAIGGTTCTTALATARDDGYVWLGSAAFETPPSSAETLERLAEALASLVADAGGRLDRLGIVCGGPLDERARLILSPPNLPGWEQVDVSTPFEQRLGVRPTLHNDANAGALAEWLWGAGRGARNLAFLTLGTGLGAGLILDGRLYRGATGLAGELGHWRLAADGPVGHGKAGSFEGFCSGGGIADWAQSLALEALESGNPNALAPTHRDVGSITARTVGKAADAGDPQAIAIWSEVGAKLGLSVALLVDLLNLETVVLGGIYCRQRARLEAPTLAAFEAEATPEAAAACRIVPSELGEEIDAWAGLAAALDGDRRTSAALLISDAASPPATAAPVEGEEVVGRP